MPVIRAAPSYVLENQLSQNTSSNTFTGNVQIVSFLFPYCTSYCPLIAAELVRLEGDLKKNGLANRVRIVSFNVDPSGSGPAQLRAFMKEYGWNPSDTRWEYLTGSPAVVHHVVYSGYMVYFKKESLAREARDAARERKEGIYRPQPTEDNKLADKAHVNYDVIHNDVLELVDPNGRIRKIYDDAEKVPEKELFSDIREILAS
jgi:protein SCO1/2